MLMLYSNKNIITHHNTYLLSSQREWHDDALRLRIIPQLNIQNNARRTKFEFVIYVPKLFLTD